MTIDPRSLIAPSIRIRSSGRAERVDATAETTRDADLGQMVGQVLRWFVLDVIDRPSVATLAALTVWILIVAAYIGS